MPSAYKSVNRSQNTVDVSIIKLDKFDNDSVVAFVDLCPNNGMCSSFLLSQFIFIAHDLLHCILGC